MNFFKSLKGNISYQYFLISIFITYFIDIIPAIYLKDYSISFWGIQKIYTFQGLLLYSITVLILCFLCIFSSRIFNYCYLKISSLISRLFAILIHPYFSLIVAIGVIFMNFFLILEFGLGYRSIEDARIINRGIIGLLTSIGTYYINGYMLFETIISHSPFTKRNIGSKISYFFGGIALFLSINSSMSTLLFLTVFISNFKSIRNFDYYYKLKLLFSKKKLNLKFLLLSLILPILLFIVALLSFIYKSQEYFNEVTSNIYLLFSQILTRISTHADSLYQLLNGCKDVCFKLDIKESILWRINFFIDQVSYKSQIISAGKINFINTFGDSVVESKSLAGSSPGIFASFFLDNTIIIGFIYSLFLASFLLFGIKTITKNLGINVGNIFLYLNYYLIFYYFLSSPLDNLQIFDPSNIFIILFSCYILRSFRIKIKLHNKLNN